MQQAPRGDRGYAKDLGRLLPVLRGAPRRAHRLAESAAKTPGLGADFAPSSRTLHCRRNLRQLWGHALLPGDMGWAKRFVAWHLPCSEDAPLAREAFAQNRVDTNRQQQKQNKHAARALSILQPRRNSCLHACTYISHGMFTSPVGMHRHPHLD